MESLEKYIKDYRLEKDYKGKELFTKLGPKIRKRGFLTKKDLIEIGKWKLKGVYGPNHVKKLTKNKDKSIKIISKIAFTLDDTRAVELLAALEQVGVPMASAILTIVYPEKYAVIDVHNWNSLFMLDKVKDKKLNPTPEVYAKYMKIIRKLANELSRTPREVDMGLFRYDEVHRKGNVYS